MCFEGTVVHRNEFFHWFRKFYTRSFLLSIFCKRLLTCIVLGLFVFLVELVCYPGPLGRWNHFAPPFLHIEGLTENYVSPLVVKFCRLLKDGKMQWICKGIRKHWFRIGTCNFSSKVKQLHEMKMVILYINVCLCRLFLQQVMNRVLLYPAYV